MWALIPVNDFSESFSRLSEHLDSDQRRELTQVMAAQVFEALFSIRRIEKIVVLTNEKEWLKSFDNQKITFLKDPKIKKLKAKITHAAKWIQNQGIQQMLYLSVDLPFVRETDIANFIAEHQGGLSIVRAHKENGTNALILDLPTTLKFQFGINSFDKHLAAAKEQKIKTKIVEIKNLSLDIDTRSDLREFKKSSMNTQFLNFIQRHNL